MTDTPKSGIPQAGNSMNCADFDARLADALDGVLAGPELETFRAHAQACTECGPLFTQAQAGMAWMKTLPEVEPPADLVHNILARTSLADMQAQAAKQPRVSWVRKASDFISPALAPAFQSMLQPRFAMTAAMAFFSISMLLNVAGLKLKDLRYLDLRPSAISTSASMQYEQTTARVVKYYENIRIVYEMQTRFRSLREAVGGESGDSQKQQAQPKKQDQRHQPNNDNSTEKQQDQQNRNYAAEAADSIMAELNIPRGNPVLKIDAASSLDVDLARRLS